MLQADVELRRQLLLLVGDGFAASELHLEGELSDQRLVLAARAPQADVALAQQALAKVQLAKRQATLLRRCLRSPALIFFAVGLLNAASAGKTLARVAMDALSPSCIWLRPN